jgi:hypothetical protein
VVLLGEVRIATPVDALIDSAAFVEQLGIRRLRLAHDVLRWRGQLQPGRLLERPQQLGGGRGDPASLVELLDLDRQAATGDGELRLGTLLARFEPAPEPQFWVTPRRRVDWWFPTVRCAIEYQGSVDHATPAGRAQDAARDGSSGRRTCASATSRLASCATRAPCSRPSPPRSPSAPTSWVSRPPGSALPERDRPPRCGSRSDASGIRTWPATVGALRRGVPRGTCGSPG